MLKVIAEDFIDPDRLDLVLPLYREPVNLTRRKEDCIACDLFTDRKDPGHFRRLVPQINAHQREPARFILMDGFAG